MTIVAILLLICLLTWRSGKSSVRFLSETLQLKAAIKVSLVLSFHHCIKVSGKVSLYL